MADECELKVLLVPLNIIVKKMIFQWKSFVKSSNSTIIYQVYGVPGAVLDILSPFIFAMTARDKHCYPHLTHEEAEVQRG